MQISWTHLLLLLWAVWKAPVPGLHARAGGITAAGHCHGTLVRPGPHSARYLWWSTVGCATGQLCPTIHYLCRDKVCCSNAACGLNRIHQLCRFPALGFSTSAAKEAQVRYAVPLCVPLQKLAVVQVAGAALSPATPLSVVWCRALAKTTSPNIAKKSSARSNVSILKKNYATSEMLKQAPLSTPGNVLISKKYAASEILENVESRLSGQVASALSGQGVSVAAWTAWRATLFLLLRASSALAWLVDTQVSARALRQSALNVLERTHVLTSAKNTPWTVAAQDVVSRVGHTSGRTMGRPTTTALPPVALPIFVAAHGEAVGVLRFATTSLPHAVKSTEVGSACPVTIRAVSNTSALISCNATRVAVVMGPAAKKEMRNRQANMPLLKMGGEVVFAPQRAAVMVHGKKLACSSATVSTEQSAVGGVDMRPARRRKAAATSFTRVATAGAAAGLIRAGCASTVQRLTGAPAAAPAAATGGLRVVAPSSARLRKATVPRGKLTQAAAAITTLRNSAAAPERLRKAGTPRGTPAGAAAAGVPGGRREASAAATGKPRETPATSSRLLVAVAAATGYLGSGAASGYCRLRLGFVATVSVPPFTPRKATTLNLRATALQAVPPVVTAAAGIRGVYNPLCTSHRSNLGGSSAAAFAWKKAKIDIRNAVPEWSECTEELVSKNMVSNKRPSIPVVAPVGQPPAMWIEDSLSELDRVFAGKRVLTGLQPLRQLADAGVETCILIGDIHATFNEDLGGRNSLPLRQHQQPHQQECAAEGLERQDQRTTPTLSTTPYKAVAGSPGVAEYSLEDATLDVIAWALAAELLPAGYHSTRRRQKVEGSQPFSHHRRTTVIALQSMLPEHAVLATLLMGSTPLTGLNRCKAASANIRQLEYLRQQNEFNQRQPHLQESQSKQLQVKHAASATTSWRDNAVPAEQREKDLRHSQQSASVGMRFYPMLMAADILAQDADYVLVGDDQQQHIEFTRHVARRWNSRFYRADTQNVAGTSIATDVASLPLTADSCPDDVAGFAASHATADPPNATSSAYAARSSATSVAACRGTTSAKTQTASSLNSGASLSPAAAEPSEAVFVAPAPFGADLPTNILRLPARLGGRRICGRLGDLGNANIKMSKSPHSPLRKNISGSVSSRYHNNGDKTPHFEAKGCIFLSDRPNVIAAKIAAAKTDNEHGVSYCYRSPTTDALKSPDSQEGDSGARADNLPAAEAAPRLECNNLVNLWCSVTGDFPASAAARFQHTSWNAFKGELTARMIDYLVPLQRRFEEVRGDTAALKAILREGSRLAQARAAETVQRVKDSMHILAL